MAIAFATVFGLGLWAGTRLLPKNLTVTPWSGDWRGISEGLRRSGRAGGFAGRRRAIIYFHDLERTASEVEILVSAWNASVPVRLHVRRNEQGLFDLNLSEAPLRVAISIPESTRDLEVALEATPAQETPHALYRIHEITLVRKNTPASYLAPLLSPLLGVATLSVLWRRVHGVLALLWSIGTAGGGLALWMTLAEPQSVYSLFPETRQGILLLGLALLWVLSLIGSRSRVFPVAGVIGTVAILYLPSLGYGFVNEDFSFARPWSWRELLATFHGSWYPEGQGIGQYFRPLVSVTFAFDHWLWGYRPAGFHLTNLIIHCVNGLLAFGLLKRLGLSPCGSLSAALAWIAHPLSTTAAVWVSQRTDGLMAIFYVSALLVLCSTSISPRRGAVVCGLGILALGCKETAVTLPMAAYLIVRLVHDAESRAKARPVNLALALLVMGYALFWSTLFTNRFLGQFGSAARRTGLDAHRPTDWLRVLTRLYGPVFAPTDYEDRWRGHNWLGLWLCLTVSFLIPLAIWWCIHRLEKSPTPARVSLLGFLWPAATIWPILAIREVDIYRLGLIICLGFGLTWGALLAFLEERSRWLPVVIAPILILWLVPISLRTSSSWGPDGFVMSLLPSWSRYFGSEWWNGLSPEMKGLFRQELARRNRARVWIQEGSE